MPTDYSRVTVVNGTRRVDLALPSALPIADVLPQLLRYSAPREQVESPAAWTVGRLGGPDLSLSRTLDESGVVDGEVLELRTPGATVPPPHVEDVRDAVEDAVDESGRQWVSDTTVGFAVLVAACGLAAAALPPAARVPGDTTAAITAGVVALLSTIGGWWADRRGHHGGAAVAMVTALLWGGVCGWVLAAGLDVSTAVAAPVAVCGSLLVASIARLLTPTATVHLAASIMLTAFGALVAACEVAGGTELTGVRIAGGAAILVVGVLPRLSLTVGGLAAADYQVRHVGLVDSADVADRVRRSAALLAGGIIGAGLVGVASGSVLAYGSAWDRWLGVAVGLGLVLRSRVFSRTPQILPLRVAGLLVLVVHAMRYIDRTPALRSWEVVLVAGAATVGVCVSAVPLSDVTRAHVKRLLNVCEALVVVTLIVLAAGALGVFDWIADSGT